ERSVEIDPDDAGGAAAIREEIERKLAIRAAHEIDAEGERRLPLSRTAIAIERHAEPAQRRALEIDLLDVRHRSVDEPDRAAAAVALRGKRDAVDRRALIRVPGHAQLGPEDPPRGRAVGSELPDLGNEPPRDPERLVSGIPRDAAQGLVDDGTASGEDLELDRAARSKLAVEHENARTDARCHPIGAGRRIEGDVLRRDAGKEHRLAKDLEL